MCAIIELILCERLQNADVVMAREGRERYPVNRVRIRSSSRIYLPPIPEPISEPQPGESSFQRNVYLFKTLKQLLNQTRKILEPRENWSRADEENVDYKNENESYPNKRMENLQKRKRKANKKCECECEKDLIINVPKYKFYDVPLGKEVSSNHINGDRYDSSASNGRSTFESMRDDYEPKESTRISQAKLKQNLVHANSFDKKDDFNFRKLIKSRLPEKNLNFKRRYSQNRKRSSNVKRYLKSKPTRRKLDDSLTEYEEPVDFISSGDYLEGSLDRSDESYEPKREDYHQYMDFDSQDVDIFENYDSDENLAESNSAENYYDSE